MLVEYPAVARKVAQEIGMDMFDDTTYQPHRLMYWPSTSSNGEFIFRVLDGDVVNPDYYLGLYDNWRDVSTWPVSSRESEAVKKTASQQAGRTRGWLRQSQGMTRISRTLLIYRYYNMNPERLLRIKKICAGFRYFIRSANSYYIFRNYPFG